MAGPCGQYQGSCEHVGRWDLDRGTCARQRFADQHRHGRVSHIVLVEQAAAAERNAHGFKIVRGDGIAKAGVITGGTVVVLELYAISVQVPAERQLAGERCRLDAGNVAYGFEGLSEEPVPNTVVVKSATGLLYLHREQV